MSTDADASPWTPREDFRLLAAYLSGDDAWAAACAAKLARRDARDCYRRLFALGAADWTPGAIRAHLVELAAILGIPEGRVSPLPPPSPPPWGYPPSAWEMRRAADATGKPYAPDWRYAPQWPTGNALSAWAIDAGDADGDVREGDGEDPMRAHAAREDADVTLVS